MADSSIVTSPDIENETQPSPTTEEAPILPAYPRIHRRAIGSPRASPYPNPTTTDNTSVRARHRADARQWGWLPTTLDTWRSEEGIQAITETMDVSPYTQEPIHHTVPVLAARLHRHEERLDAMELEQHETRLGWMHLAQGWIAQIYQDQEDLTEAMDVTHDQVVETRDEVTALRLRLEQCELRSQEAEQYTRMLEQRLTLAEENARQAGRLAEAMDQIIALLPQLDQHQD